MRVVEVTSFGGPEVLRVRTLPDPVAGAGQVVIDVAVAGVHFVDTWIRRGMGGQYFPVQPPYVPGGGVAGVVLSVGDGVDGDWVGRRVVVGGDNTSYGHSGVGYLSQAVASVGSLFVVPEGVGLPEAMALFHDGATALALVETAPVGEGATALVQPASGGAGTLLVQLLRERGVRVVGVASGEAKLALVKELGADVVVGYSGVGSVGAVDVAFDGVGGEAGTAAFGVVREGGWFSNYGNASGAPADVPRDGSVRVRGMEQLATFGGEFRRRVGKVFAAAAAGVIRPVIGATFSLGEAGEAHRALESRAVMGKVLLVP
ncbi:zinc-binding dehydrogenase [Actinocrispum sp. NPDC049592]|uniref:zinc-binding dehydrogenase n=1 Tax=Actinocrispum sp. NPDC049592 TaxID=3154835 RepID=UPI00341AB532